MKTSRFYYGRLKTSMTAEVYLDLHNKVADFIQDTIHYFNVKRVTVCGILDTEANTLSFGVSVCSGKDRFEKAIGRKLSEQRALTNPLMVIPVTKENVSKTFMETAQKLDDQFLNLKHYSFD